jgi:hypothetical protein
VNGGSPTEHWPGGRTISWSGSGTVSEGGSGSGTVSNAATASTRPTTSSGTTTITSNKHNRNISRSTDSNKWPLGACSKGASGAQHSHPPTSCAGGVAAANGHDAASGLPLQEETHARHTLSKSSSGGARVALSRLSTCSPVPEGEELRSPTVSLNRVCDVAAAAARGGDRVGKEGVPSVRRSVQRGASMGDFRHSRTLSGTHALQPVPSARSLVPSFSSLPPSELLSQEREVTMRGGIPCRTSASNAAEELRSDR